MWSTKTAAIAIMIALSCGLSPTQGSHAAPLAAATSAPSTLTFEAGSGRLITLSGAAANVFVADPKVAEVRPASPGALFVFGVGPGRTTIAAVDAAGQTLLDTQIVVEPSSFCCDAGSSRRSTCSPGPAHQRAGRRRAA